MVSANGDIEAEIDRSHLAGTMGDTNYPFLVLADVDGNGIVEIMFQQDGIHAVNASGDELPGFPLEGGIYFSVGDIDGDNAQEIVTFLDYETQLIDDPRVYLTIYEADGRKKQTEILIDHVTATQGSIMPVIADLDNDGRNEIVVTGDEWLGASQEYFKLWVFDLKGPAIHGNVEWGDQYGNKSNTGAHKSVMQ